MSYLSGHKEGHLWKRRKDKKNFQRRRFVLDTTENTLKYYTKEVNNLCHCGDWSFDIFSFNALCND